MSESTIFELIYPLLWYWLASNHIMAYHVKEVHLKSENICGLVPLLPQTPIWQFWKVWYYVSLKKIVWYYTSLRVWYYMSLTKSVWYSASLREYDTICRILCALPVMSTRGRQLKKVCCLRTFFNRFWPKSNWSTKRFSFDLNLELQGGLKVGGCEINFIK